MRFIGWLCLLVVLPVAVAQSPSSAERDADPLEIRRVLVTPEQFATQLTKERADTLVRMARTEFEHRVQQLARLNTLKAPPRLIEARYIAKLVDENLTGTGEWKIVHRVGGPAFMTVETARDPFSVAVREAKWPDAQPAYFDRLAIGNAAPLMQLLVEEPGERSLSLEWSARGITEPGELRFELGLPASPLALLELDLPQNVTPSSGQPGAVVTGPLPGSKDDRRLWQISFGGHGRLDLSLRRPKGPEQPRALVRTRQTTRQEIIPGQVLSRHEIELEVLHGGVQELTLECVGNMRPIDVRLAGIESWTIENGSPQRIKLRLREPIAGGRLELTTIAPLPLADNSPTWISPGVRVVDAIDAGERIEWRIHPDLHLGEWNAGGFRLANTRTAEDRAQILSLEPTLLPSNASPLRPRPSAKWRLIGPEFSVQQTNVFDLQPERTIVSVEFRCTVKRGFLTKLPLLIPPGYRIESLAVRPSELIPQVSAPTGNPPIVNVEFQKPLTPETPSEWTLRLRGPGIRAGVFALPDVLPVGVRSRTGVAQIRIPTGWDALRSPLLARSEVVPFTIPQAIIGSSLLLGESERSSSMFQFVLSNYLFDGSLTLRPRWLEQTAKLRGDVHADATSIRVTGEVEVPPTTQSTLLVYVAAPGAKLIGAEIVSGPNRVVGMRAMASGKVFPWVQVLASQSPWEQLLRTTIAKQTDGGWYAIDFARPIAERVTLSFASELTSTRTVPIVLFPTLHPIIGQYTVTLPGTGVLAVKWTGFREIPAPQRTLELTQAPHSIELVPVGPVAQSGRIDSAELLTRVESNGRTLCRFRVQLSHFTRRTLPVRLPPNTHPIAIAVDGRWIDQTGFVPQPDGAFAFDVPVRPDDASQSIEWIYAVDRKSWWLHTRLDAVMPELPFPLPVVHRTWQLPPNVVPIDEFALTAQPGNDRSLMLPALPANLARPLFDAVNPVPPVPSSPLFEAAVPSQATTFGEMLRRMLDLGDRTALILDTTALAEAGLSPNSPFRFTVPTAPPIWDAIGLTLVPCGGQALLTTPQQASWWRANMQASLGPWPRSLEVAVQNAARQGRDPTGRFRTVADWLEQSSHLRNDFLPTPMPGTTTWEEWAAPTADGPHIIYRSRLGQFGWCVAFGLSLLVLTVVSLKPRLGGFVLLFWLLIACVGFVLIPTAWRDGLRPSILAGLSLAGLLILRRQRWKLAKDPPTKVSTSKVMSSRIVRAGVIVLLCAMPVYAIAPDVETVYLLTDDNDSVASRIAMVPQSLLDRIEEMKRKAFPLPPVVILSAHYEMKWTDQTLLIDGRFVLRSFQDESSKLALPLTGVQLREAMLDGAPAIPTRPKGEVDRYLIDVQGKGIHQLIVKFAVPIVGTEPDREAKFGIPELVQSRLTFDAPANLRQLQAVNWRGAQTVFPMPGGQRLEVDLGRTRVAHLRWRTESGPATPAQVRVQELGVWDLDTVSARLQTTFGYRITQGTISALRLEIPPGLDVARIELKTAESTSSPTPISLLRNWRIARTPNSPATLLIELQGPTTGELRLQLELVQTGLLSSQPELRFPTPLDATEFDAHFAIRVAEVTLNGLPEKRGVNDSFADVFFRDLWQPIQLTKAGSQPQKSYTLIRGETPVLRPTLQLTSPVVNGTQELRWWITAQKIELAADVTWESVGKLRFVEWEVPSNIGITELGGPDVRSWSRSGNRVQVWLREPIAKVRISARGVAPKLASNGIFDLPLIRPIGVTRSRTNLRLEPQPGWTLTLTQLAQLNEDDANALGRELRYVADQNFYQAQFQARPPQNDAAYRVQQSASVRDGQLRLETDIQTNLKADRPHVFGLRIASGTSMRYRVVTPDECEVNELPSRGDERSWTVEIPRGLTSPSFTLLGEQPFGEPFQWSMPEVEIESGDGPSRVERSLVLSGSEITPEVMRGLQRTERGWRVVAPEWRFVTRVRPLRGVGASSILVGLIDCQATRIDERWIYRASIDYATEARTSLSLRWPSGAVIEAISLDGVEIPDATSLPMDVEGRSHRLQVIWSFPGDQGLRTEPVRLVTSAGDVLTGLTLWTITVGSGERLERVGSPKNPLAPAIRDLRSAESCIKLADWLRKSGTAQSAWTGLVVRCERQLRLVETRLAGVRPVGLTETGPENQPLIEWVADLRTQWNALKDRLPDGLPNRTTESGDATWDHLPFAEPFREGTPSLWGELAVRDATFEVVATDGPQWAGRIGTMWLVLAALIAVALMVGLSGTATRSEQVALLGVVGIVTFGWPDGAVFVGVVLLALGLRVLSLVGWAMGWLFGRSREMVRGT